MTRASSARRIAAAAVYGGGGLAGLGIAGFGVLMAEARIARRAIGQPFGSVGPDGSGLYGHCRGEPLEFAMLGRLQRRRPRRRGRPAHARAPCWPAVSPHWPSRPVRLTVVAVVGAESRRPRRPDRPAAPAPPHAARRADHDRRQRRDPPDEAVGVGPLTSTDAVRRLRERGAEVVVGTCPDLGTIEPIPQPLRYMRPPVEPAAGRRADRRRRRGRRPHRLARRPARPRVRAPGRGRCSPTTASTPRPPATPRPPPRCCPSVCAALDLCRASRPRSGPTCGRARACDDVAHAAARAASEPGTEVAGDGDRRQHARPEGPLGACSCAGGVRACRCAASRRGACPSGP